MQVRLPEDVVVRTSRLDELAAAYARIYAPPRVAMNDHRPLKAVGSQRNLGRVRIGYGRYGAATDWEFPHAECYLYLLPLEGGGTLRTRSRDCELAPGVSAIVSPETGYHAQYNAAFEGLSIKFERSLLKAVLESMTGNPIGAPLVFEPQAGRAPWASALQNYLRQLVDTLEQTRPEALPEWWLSQTEHMLAALVLSEERHNYSLLFDKQAADPSREQVLRAEEYIEANKDRAFSPEGLARACGVSVLSLYRAFKRARGCSPLEFASRLRAAGNSHHGDPG